MTILNGLRAGLLLTAALSAATASAHDFFLLPDRFTAPIGETRLRASVSASFPRLENVVPADRVGRLHAAGVGNPSIRIAGPAPNALDLSLSAPRGGLVIAGVSALPRDVDYPHDRIGVILEEYRIDASIVAPLARLPEPRTLRVSSRRFAKTMVCVVRCRDRSAADRPLGADLEFVGVGRRTDRFVLLRRGQPLPDHPADVVTADGRRSHLRTDANGRLHLPAAARGTLMLFAASMEPPAGAGERFILNLSSLTLSR